MPKGIYKRIKLPVKYWQGKKFSKEHKRKMSETVKKKIQERGYLNSPETRKKISDTLKRKGIKPPGCSKESYLRGKNHPFWKGGISFEPYTIDWTETLRRSIRERDHYVCQLCNQYGNIIHHIDYDKKNCNSDNLITLCRKCHGKTDYNRKFWQEYFSNLIKTRKNPNFITED